MRAWQHKRFPGRLQIGPPQNEREQYEVVEVLPAAEYEATQAALAAAEKVFARMVRNGDGPRARIVRMEFDKARKLIRDAKGAEDAG